MASQKHDNCKTLYGYSLLNEAPVQNTMILSDSEKKLLDGNAGEAFRIAMSVICDIGNLYGAKRLIPVSQVHIDTTLYIVEAGAEFAEQMAHLGAVFSVPTSLNPSSIDLVRWKEYRVPPDFLENNRRLERAYLKMGAAPTWTCTPYQHGIIPRFGEQIAWGESNAIAFVNSVIGARTNRYADLMDICAAIIGRVPEFGLHLTKNRKAELVFDITDLSTDLKGRPEFYPVLGYLIGELAEDRIAAVRGAPPDIPIDWLKHFYAAAASSGGVSLVHIVGVTPEAHTLDMCTNAGKEPPACFITPELLKKTEDKLHVTRSGNLDLVTVGCPHYSFNEFVTLARRFSGKKVHSATVFWAFTCRSVYALIDNCGLLKELSDAGVMVFTDGCPLQYPKSSWDFTNVMTDSAKFANYSYSQTGLHPAFGTVEDCVRSAVEGSIRRKEIEWK